MQTAINAMINGVRTFGSVTNSSETHYNQVADKLCIIMIIILDYVNLFKLPSTQ